VNFGTVSVLITRIVDPCFTGAEEGVDAVSLFEHEANKKETKRILTHA